MRKRQHQITLKNESLEHLIKALLLLEDEYTIETMSYKFILKADKKLDIVHVRTQILKWLRFRLVNKED
jgi:DNA gyrase/topoisomerase IV subunit B